MSLLSRIMQKIRIGRREESIHPQGPRIVKIIPSDGRLGYSPTEAVDVCLDNGTRCTVRRYSLTTSNQDT